MKTVTKVQFGPATTKTGKPITVYKITKIKPKDPDYQKEVKLRDEYLENKSKTLSVHPSVMAHK